AGVAGVACSAMVYAVTRRAWWALPRTTAKFALGSLSMGAATVLVTSLALALSIGGTAAARATSELAPALALLAAGAAGAKLAGEATVLRHLRAGDDDELHRSALLLVGPLRAASRWRLATGAASMVLLGAAVPASAAGATATVVALATSGLVVLVAGELLERWQFFTAAAPARMPGGPA
ncbi:MAG: hypothetical protein ACR2K0_00430, partial [Acidimicrobiales bacterium]